jgi:hypothetical protein
MKNNNITYNNITYQYTTKHGVSCKQCDFSDLDYCPCDSCSNGVYKKITILRKEKIKKIISEDN